MWVVSSSLDLCCVVLNPGICRAPCWQHHPHCGGMQRHHPLPELTHRQPQRPAQRTKRLRQQETSLPLPGGVHQEEQRDGGGELTVRNQDDGIVTSCQSSVSWVYF